MTPSLLSPLVGPELLLRRSFCKRSHFSLSLEICSRSPSISTWRAASFSSLSCCISPSCTNNSSLSRSSCSRSSWIDVNSSRRSPTFSLAWSSASRLLIRASKASRSTELKASATWDDSSLTWSRRTCASCASSSLSFIRASLSSAAKEFSNRSLSRRLFVVLISCNWLSKSKIVCCASEFALWDVSKSFFSRSNSVVLATRALKVPSFSCSKAWFLSISSLFWFMIDSISSFIMSALALHLDTSCSNWLVLISRASTASAFSRRMASFLSINSLFWLMIDFISSLITSTLVLFADASFWFSSRVALTDSKAEDSCIFSSSSFVIVSVNLAHSDWEYSSLCLQSSHWALKFIISLDASLRRFSMPCIVTLWSLSKSAICACNFEICSLAWLELSLIAFSWSERVLSKTTWSSSALLERDAHSWDLSSSDFLNTAISWWSWDASDNCEFKVLICASKLSIARIFSSRASWSSDLLLSTASKLFCKSINFLLCS